MIVGTIQAFNEADKIVGAIESLWEAGVDRVVVVDGAWKNPDGTPFGGGSWYSTDGTMELSEEAGADVVIPRVPFGGDGDKRTLLLQLSGCERGDFALLLDADERLVGRINPKVSPSDHGCIVLWNDKPNDLDFRTPWLDAAVRPNVPMLRWLKWSHDLRCVAPGRYEDRSGPVRVYLTEVLAWRSTHSHLDRYGLAALAALRSVETQLPNDHLTWLPIVPGIEIRHSVPASAARIEQKRRHYEEATK